MKGKDIGSLKVYIQTNETKMLVWNTTGEQGDKWNFGQVGYKGDTKSYKVRVSLHATSSLITLLNLIFRSNVLNFITEIRQSQN